jgi:hypothetical protein
VTYVLAFRDTNPGNLTVIAPSGATRSGLGVAEGTSPCVAARPSGPEGCIVAFHATGDLLWYWLDGGYCESLDGPLDPRTSPAVVWRPEADQSLIVSVKDKHLICNRFLGEEPFEVAPETSPALARLPGGDDISADEWCLAWAGPGNHLWIRRPEYVGSTGLPMMPGTSPSIAAWRESGGREASQVVYQSDHGLLASSSVDSGDWNLAMRSGTSPSIAAQPHGDWLIAFQNPFGQLWTVSPDGPTSLGVEIRSDSSPSVAALEGGGFQIAYCDPATGNVRTIGSSGPTETGIALSPGTSPSIAGFS